MPELYGWVAGAIWWTFAVERVKWTFYSKMPTLRTGTPTWNTRLILGVYVLVALICGVNILLQRNTSLWSTLCGVGVLLVGICLRCAARRELGLSWNWDCKPVPDVRLVTTGVFRYIRHPYYCGTTLELAGLILIVGSSVAMSVYGCAFLPMMLFRIRLEESLLIEQYGDAYRCYVEQRTSYRQDPERSK